MTNIIDIQEQLCSEIPLFNEHTIPSISTDDDKLPQATYLLSSPKNCGMLILINKLLSSINAKIIHQSKNRSTYRLVDQLLSNFQRSKITILPSSADDSIDFALHLLKIAKYITSHHPQLELHPYSKNLIEAMKVVELSETTENIALLEKCWKEFAFCYFKQKLNLLMQS